MDPREGAGHAYGAALIADEIQCGLGRTGRAFAYQRHVGLPDIAVVAKPLAGGLPLGAILSAGRLRRSVFLPGLHGSTFGGGPFTCAVALEFLETIEDEDLLDNIRQRGIAQRRAGLSRMGAEFDFIRELRGEGLMFGLELSVEGKTYVANALKQGLIINCTHDHVIRLLPPYIVERAPGSRFSGAAPHGFRQNQTATWPAPRLPRMRILLTRSSPPDRLIMTATPSTADCWGTSLDWLRIGDFGRVSELKEILALATLMKAHPAEFRSALAGKQVVMFFEKPSLRTRITFEAGTASLGGQAIFVDQTNGRIDARESLADIAHNLERWVHGIVLRTFAHATVEGMAQHAYDSGD